MKRLQINSPWHTWPVGDTTRRRRPTGIAVSVAGARRAPVQARSRQRVEDILETTARLVDVLGPDNVTTTSIADSLEISVGSIYNYFEDRSAIFDAIVARSIAAHDAIIAATRASTPANDRRPPEAWLEMAFTVIDRLADAYRTEPGFRALWFSQHLSPAMLESMRRSDEAQARRLLDALTGAGLYLDCPNRLDAMRMHVGLIDKGLDLAFRDSPSGNDQIIAETKQVVRQYIGAYLKPLPDGPAGGSGG